MTREERLAVLTQPVDPRPRPQRKTKQKLVRKVK